MYIRTYVLRTVSVPEMRAAEYCNLNHPARVLPSRHGVWHHVTPGRVTVTLPASDGGVQTPASDGLAADDAESRDRRYF